ncbi:MAG TPA: penicillin-binding protein [Blastocatellia bacterium]|nr:penicillin-binding protein [Blastocatellia bacterium]
MHKRAPKSDLLTSPARAYSGRRLGLIQGLLIVWMLVIGARLASLQLHDYAALRARADRQQRAAIDLSPTRGVIYDRNGNELARSVEVKSLYAAPAEVLSADATADQLARILHVDRDDLYRRLTSDKVMAALKRKLTAEEAAEVEALALPGLRLVDEMKRFYVGDRTAAHVLGFVDVDEQGKGGVELSYDRVVRGRGGRLVLNLDAAKRSYDHEFQESVPGANVTLTIDIVVQRSVEKTLAEAVRATGSRAGTAVLIRPATGEILALANFPSFNPNHVSESSDSERHNYAVETAFEPGSILKLVTYAAAIEEGIISPNTRIDCGSGEIRVGARVLRDGHAGMLTARQALAKSSNVAAIKLGQWLGNQRLERYIGGFGFGRRTGIELPAESRGLLRPAREWDDNSMGSIPIGHEISVTAVQAASAFACIANGGEWIQPHLVSRVASPSGEVIEEPKLEKRRVVQEATAAVLKDMLEGVILHGTGKLAQVSGYRAAGKTGTAQKIDEETGRYSKTRYVASFAGFAPVDNPEIACLISLDEPRGAHQGGKAAAPVFARIVSDALHILGVPAEDDPQAELIAGDYETYDVPWDEAIRPEPDSTRRNIAVGLADASDAETASKPRGSVLVPDLVGRGIRDAVALCSERGLKIKASGDGVVSSQSPPPGTIVTAEAICHVRLSRMNENREKPDSRSSRSAGGVARGATTRTN